MSIIFNSTGLEPPSYDLVIAGLGAAGLSLLRDVMEREELRGRRVLAIDRDPSPKRDKTWCFWAKPNASIANWADHSWPALEVVADGRRHTRRLNGYRYHCVSSESYARAILDMARKRENVTLLKASIQGFEASEDHVTVHTDAGSHRGEWCFQSSIRPEPLRLAGGEIRLLQHFVGWEIRTQSAVFDPERAILMDFDVPQANGVTFFYVLPFSETHALVEYTVFSQTLLSDSLYDEGVASYLADRFGLDGDRFEILRREKGAIPMETDRLPQMMNARTYNIGTVGGHTKPSTGYTFMRIQKQVGQIVRDLANGNAPHHVGSSNLRFRIYDLMLLSILERDPAIGLRIFSILFRRNPMERILRFLDEETHLGSELWIFSRLPYLPFFRSMHLMRKRILSGA